MQQVPQPPAGGSGRVVLVGAGPGDPRLLTLRAAGALGLAEAVLYVPSVDPRVLDYTRPSAELCSTAELAGAIGAEHWAVGPGPRWLAERAKAGKTVAYLADGDPMLFSHGGELLDRLRATGVAVEVIPGVTAASAAAAVAAIPVTHAAHSSAVALVTARGPHGRDPPEMAPFARFPGTLAVYMGVEPSQQWSRPLIEAGRPAETPVAVVAACARAEQQVIRTTLGSLAGAIDREGIRPPAVVLVGPAVAAAPAAATRRGALWGRRVLVTRPRAQSGELVDRLAALDAEVWTQPVIEISDPPDWAPVDRAIARIEQYDWIAFSSVNGVERLLGRLRAGGSDARRLAAVGLAAIGPATAASLEPFGLKADLVPATYRAEALADALIERFGVDATARRVLLARASRGREVLAERLRAAGAQVEQVVVYTSSDVLEPRRHVREALEQGRLHWTLVTSSAIARALAGLFGEHLKTTHLASISPVTSQTLRDLGYEVAAEATEYTMDGLVAAIIK